MKCANSEESDQTAFERSLIRLYTVCKHNDGLLRNVTSKSNILRNANTVLSGSLLFSYHWKVLMPNSTHSSIIVSYLIIIRASQEKS